MAAPLPSSTDNRALDARLAELEAELKTMRRQLGATERSRTALPSGDWPLLRCSVGADAYGIPLEWVAEIVRYVQVTRVADLPEMLAGVINVRGQVVAVIDARARFGHEVTAPRRGTAIVLMRAGSRHAGLIVDNVKDVVVAPQGSLREPSGPLAKAHAICALATLEREVLQVIDLDHVLSGAEWAHVERVIESQPPLPSHDHASGSAP
jgi:purine-binding chemotaxis protein CheW